MAQKQVSLASLHSLRHFSASMLLSQHVPITVVSKRLGHANSQITLDVYLRNKVFKATSMLRS